jgi:YihY family inner membrane protein
MSTANLVPETRELSGDDAWQALRRTGRRRLLVDAFMRMRVSDGFSHARSLALLISLVALQGTIAVVGLAGAVGGSGFSNVVAAAVRRIVPGPAGEVLTEAVVHAHATGVEHRFVAVVVGLVGSIVTATTAYGQIERGLNRIYGVELDRSTIDKYGRAIILAITTGTLASLAFVCVAFGRNLLHPVTKGTWSTVWNFVSLPLGLVLITVAVTIVFMTCPRRCQPHFSWLAVGSGIAVTLWVVVTAGLGFFFHSSHSFGQTYGPLAGVVALLLWSLLSSVALFFGAAFAAQLESVRQGDPEPQDSEKVAHAEPADDEDTSSAPSRMPAISGRRERA